MAKLRRKLGIVFQDFRLLENRTVGAERRFALEVIGAPGAVIGGKVARVLTQVGLAVEGTRATRASCRAASSSASRSRARW